jgi:hypothetical protein
MSRMLKKMEQYGLIGKEASHRGRYFIQGHENGAPRKGTQIDIELHLLDFYFFLGWKFHSQIGQGKVRIQYSPPQEIEAGGQNFQEIRQMPLKGEQMRISRAQLTEFDTVGWRVVAELGESLILEYDPPLAIPSAN